LAYNLGLCLLGKLEGLAGQEKLRRQTESGLVVIHQLNAASVMRMRVLMTKYGDAPMDFADASLVTLAERIDDREVFTFDQHFHTYRIHDRIPFEVIP
jgi:predicted nucleic acid-binding protein